MSFGQLTEGHWHANIETCEMVWGKQVGQVGVGEREVGGEEEEKSCALILGLHICHCFCTIFGRLVYLRKECIG